MSANAPQGSGYWGASGLYLFKDADNYISVERKSRSNTSNEREVMALVREVNQSAAEYWDDGNVDTAPSMAHIDNVWYRLSRDGSTITAAYSTDGTTFKTISSNTDTSFLDGERTIALATATGNNDSHPVTTFSDLSITSNGETKAFALTRKVELAAPTSVSVTDDEESQTLHASANTDSANGSISYVWQSADSLDGPWTVETGLHGDNAQYDDKLNGKYLRVLAYTVENGIVGPAAESAAVLIKNAQEVENPAATKESSETRLGKAQSKSLTQKTSAVSSFPVSTGICSRMKIRRRSPMTSQPLHRMPKSQSASTTSRSMPRRMM